VQDVAYLSCSYSKDVRRTLINLSIAFYSGLIIMIGYSICRSITVAAQSKAWNLLHPLEH
jgi:hypothetical protein